MNAAVITIGQEILIGQIIDTNSAWIASQLNLIGVDVKKIVSISDSTQEIETTVYELHMNYDLVITTGGLGPTNDDVTKLALSNVFKSELQLHSNTLLHIEELFAKRNLPLTELNRRQALLPHNCTVLFNPVGTAPGMWFESRNRIVVALPGVPFEMTAIMEQEVLPRLKSLNEGKAIVHKTILTFGLPESFLAEKIKSWESQLPENITLAYLPGPTAIRLRLSSKGSNPSQIEQTIQEQIDKLQPVIPEYLFGFESDTLPSVVGQRLTKNKKSLAVAESCTGGYLAHMITLVPGSSNYFLGGVVAYSNQLKISLLGVNPESLNQFGAVSKQVAEEMAAGLKKITGAHYTIATTGIAGPSGETLGKPVGLIWIALATPNGIVSQSFNFANDRERNIVRSSASALNMLRLQLLSE